MCVLLTNGSKERQIMKQAIDARMGLFFSISVLSVSPERIATESPTRKRLIVSTNSKFFH